MKRSLLFLATLPFLANCGGNETKPAQPITSASTTPPPVMQPVPPTKTVTQPIVKPQENTPVTPPVSGCTTCQKTTPPPPAAVPPVVPRPTVQAPQPVEIPANIGSKLSADEVKTLLTLHNQARAAVGTPPLTWSSDAAVHVQSWVDQLAATSCNLQHRQPNQYGENLFMGSGGYGVADASKAWENEKFAYNGAPISMSNFSGIGHYTQMVWSTTTKVGCGKASCNNGMLIIGCNYDPAGNMVGQKPY